MNVMLPALSIAAILTVPAAAVHGQEAGSRIAFVNEQDVLRAAPCYSQADSIWRGEVEGYNRELSRLQEYADSAGHAFQLTSPLLTGSARTAKLKTLRQLDDSVRKVAGGMQARVRERQQQWFAPIEAQINAVVDSLRIEKNLDYVWDMNALGSSVVALRKSLDLTPKVIARLKVHADTTTVVSQSNQAHRVTPKDIERLQLHADSSSVNKCSQAPPTTP